MWNNLVLISIFLVEFVRPEFIACTVATKGAETKCVVKNMIRLDALASSAKNASNVTKVEFMDSSISLLDGTIFETFGNLVELNMSRTGVREIKDGAFKRAGNLKILNLDENDIEKLDVNSLNGAYSLQILYLGYNKIHTIDKLAFFGLKKLQYLGLQHNNISGFENGTFDPLVSVTEINLNYNYLTSINHELFAKTSLLENLTLSNNEISSLSTEDMKLFQKFKIFDLKYNPGFNKTFSGDDIKRLILTETGSTDEIRFELLEQQQFSAEKTSSGGSGLHVTLFYLIVFVCLVFRLVI